jgi:hypothetical protein
MATVTSVDLHTMVPSSRLQFPLDLEPQELSAPHQINQSGEGEVFSDNIPTSPPAMSSTQPAQHELHPTFSTTMMADSRAYTNLRVPTSALSPLLQTSFF